MADEKNLSTVDHLLLLALRSKASSNQQFAELAEAVAAVVEELDSVKADAEETEKALKSKQDELTFDTTPTEGSSNPVTSDGIAKCMTNVVGDIDTVLASLLDGGTIAEINEILDEINGEVIL